MQQIRQLHPGIRATPCHTLITSIDGPTSLSTAMMRSSYFHVAFNGQVQPKGLQTDVLVVMSWYHRAGEQKE